MTNERTLKLIPEARSALVWLRAHIGEDDDAIILSALEMWQQLRPLIEQEKLFFTEPPRRSDTKVYGWKVKITFPDTTGTPTAQLASINVNDSQRLAEVLEQVARDGKINHTEAVNQALQVYVFVRKELAEGKRFYLLQPNTSIQPLDL